MLYPSHILCITIIIFVKLWNNNDKNKIFNFLGLWNATSSLTSTAKPSPPSQYKVGDVEFSYTNFTQIDHRVKLHLFLNIFEDENEELVWLIRAEILSHNAEQTFSGCVVLSTRKFYVLKIEGDIIG